MCMKTRFVFGVLLLMIASRSGGQSAPVAPGWKERLRDAMRRAADRNPELTAVDARLDAARRRILQAAALPDPEIELGLKDVPPSRFSLSRDDFTMEVVAARQRLPGFGKLSAQKRASRAEFEAARFGHVHHVLEVAAEVADAFLRLAELDSRVAIVEETRGWLSDAVTASRERYRVGKGSQADVLRANLEKTALEDRLTALKAARRTEAARFNALQNLPAQ